ncbi:MAG: hypothetical protein PHQ91_03260 [Thermoanaerobaculaceae bacterium]|nr:hypothetical protein [Thermoanaerobaculaceae bacterium]
MRFLLVGTVVGLAAGTGTILAATKTWTGAGGDNFWTTAANWGGTVPVAGDDLVFPSGAARLTNTNNLTPGTSFNSISFTGPAGGYAISGNDIQLVAGLTADNSATNSVNLFIVLTASQTFTVSGDRLRLGAIELGSHTLTFAGASGIVELNGIVSGTGGISSSAGVVFLLVSASYTGPTTVTAGSFAVVGPSLSLSSVVTVNGGLLQYANGGRTGPVTVNAPGRLFCGGGATQLGSLTDLTMQSGSMLSMAMNSLSDYGQLNPASGNVSLGNATLDLGWSFTSITGDAFTIINKTSAGAITGTFAGLAEGATFTGNGRTYQITYVGGTGNDVVITDVTAGGPTPTPTPTATPTATPTPTPTVTPTSPPTPGPDIPTTGGGGAIAFMILLAVAGVLLVRRYTS